MGSGNSTAKMQSSSSFGSDSDSDGYPAATANPASGHSYPHQSHPIANSIPTSSCEYEAPSGNRPAQRPTNNLRRRYSKFADNYDSLDQGEVGEPLWTIDLMGSGSSKAKRRRSSSFGYDSGSDGYPATTANPAPGYSYPRQSHPIGNSIPTASYEYEAPSGSCPAQRPTNKLRRRYSRIADNYNSLDQVTESLAQAGLESSNLIVGIDFTKSNEWTGAKSFNHRSLHHTGNSANPYEQAISIIGRTLSAFDEDNLIPCFGFGDASTHDQNVFNFHPDERPCVGFEEALKCYREIVPNLQLAGPTSFAPIIQMAMTIVERSGGQYHVLLIIADGQVTRSVDTEKAHLSSQEQKTVDAIVRASEYPLSIILVGVGDGPWDMMKEFDDNIPARAFDNFQFVNFTDIMSKNVPISRKETEFALAALMEIPLQYRATLDLNILGRRVGKASESAPLGPPLCNHVPFLDSKASRLSDSQPTHYEHTRSSGPEPSASSAWDNQLCPICLMNPKDMVFGCGHQTCCRCGPSLSLCPICRSCIETRIKLY